MVAAGVIEGDSFLVTSKQKDAVLAKLTRRHAFQLETLELKTNNIIVIYPVFY
jgi:hypothetical protein